MRTFIILIIVIVSCSPKKKESLEQEFTELASNTESTQQMLPSEPNKLYSRVFGQWYTEGNEGVVPHWFEFESKGSNFYSWIDKEEERSELPTGTYEIVSDSILQLHYNEYGQVEKHYLNFYEEDKIVLTPFGPSAGELEFTMKSYKSPPKKWMIPEELTINKIEGVKWLNSNFDGCTRYYIFKEQNNYFEHFNCSMDELDTGRFVIVYDTLKIYEYHLISEVPVALGGTEGTEVRFEYHYILNQDFLRPTFYRDHKYDSEKMEMDTLHQYKRL